MEVRNDAEGAWDLSWNCSAHQLESEEYLPSLKAHTWKKEGLANCAGSLWFYILMVLTIVREDRSLILNGKYKISHPIKESIFSGILNNKSVHLIKKRFPPVLKTSDFKKKMKFPKQHITQKALYQHLLHPQCRLLAEALLGGACHGWGVLRGIGMVELLLCI